MSNEKQIRFEDNAERKSLTGWCCKTCGRYWGEDERAAKYCCCTDRKCCSCDRRVNKHRIRCDECQSLLDIEKYAKCERKCWDGTQMLYSHVADEFFSNPEDIAEHFYDADGVELSMPALAEDKQIVLCNPVYARPFNLSEYLGDDLPEESEPPAGWRDVEDVVNKWLDAQGPLSWSPSKYAWNGEG